MGFDQKTALRTRDPLRFGLAHAEFGAGLAADDGGIDGEILSNQPRRHLGGHHDAGGACPRLGTCTDKVQVADVFAAVVASEKGRLHQQRLWAKGVALVGVEGALEVVGGDVALADKALPQVGQVAPVFEVAEDGLTELFPGFVPVDAGVIIRHGHQGIGGVVPRRGEGGVSQRRQVQVLGEVLGEHLAAKDVFQQPLVAGAEQDGVVAEFFGFGAVGLEAKVNHKHRHRLLGQLHPQIAVPEAVLGFDQFAVGVGPVAVRNHHVRVHHGAIG